MRNLRFLVLTLLALNSLAGSASAYYHPDEGRWLSRDPIHERGGLNLYAFVKNDPNSKVDLLGMWPWNGCCEGKPYNRITHCCCKKDGVEHIVSRRAISTGIKSCFIWRTDGGYPHAYVVVDRWSAGFYPAGFPFGGPGQIISPDPHMGEGSCSDVKLSPCSFDFQKVKDAIKAFADMSYGFYFYGARDCRHWRNDAIVYGEAKGAGCTAP